MVGQKEARNPKIFAKDENVGERQYTLIGYNINCTELLITIRLYSISFRHRCPSSRCLDTFLMRCLTLMGCF